MFSKILVFCCCFGAVFASYCGPFSVPYSFEVLPTGEIKLGCARSKCLGITPTKEDAQIGTYFPEINSVQDGFLKMDEFDSEPNPLVNSMVICHNVYQQECNLPNQWIGGIAPVDQDNNASLSVLCCSYDPLHYSRAIGIATVSNGQIYSGGDVQPENELPSFDYIFNIQKMVSSGQITYQIYVKRIVCLPRPLPMGMNAFQAPIYTAHLPPATANLPAPSQPVYSVYGPHGVPNMAAVPAPVPMCVSCVPDFYCFSGESFVFMAEGKRKKMKNVRVGDWIMTTTKSGDSLAFSRVNSWIHRKTDEEAQFLQLKFQNGHVLKVTSKHYLFRAVCGSQKVDNYHLDKVFAQELSMGECVYFVQDGVGSKASIVKVVDIKVVTERGYYAPLTSSESIVVDGIVASCHGQFGPSVFHSLVEGMINFWRNSVMYRSWNKLVTNLRENEYDLFPGWKLMLTFFKPILEDQSLFLNLDFRKFEL